MHAYCDIIELIFRWAFDRYYTDETYVFEKRYKEYIMMDIKGNIFHKRIFMVIL